MSGGTRSYALARRLVAAGHQVHMVASWRSSDTGAKDWRQEELDGIQIHWLSVPYSNQMNYQDRMRSFFKFTFAAGRRAAQVGGDVVFATSTPLTIALAGVYASKRLRVPMVFEVRDLWPEVPIAIGALKNPLAIAGARWLERFAYRNSVRIIALSLGMADGVVRAGYPRNRVSVIPNSCDIELFRVPEGIREGFLKNFPQLHGGPLVVYTGTLGTVNGVAYLAEIAHAMQRIDPTVRFLIVGDGKETVAVKTRAVELDVLDKNLWMLSAVPKNEVPAILSSATIATSLFIDLPELCHNSANKFFDALAAGRPIMINHQGWQADLLKETGAGIVVPPSDPVAAAKILHILLNDEDRLGKARHAATQLAETMFDRDVLAKKLLSVLTQAAKSDAI